MNIVIKLNGGTIMFELSKTYKATFILIAIWIILFLINKRVNLLYYLAGIGVDNIGNEYYRFFTGPLLHFNLIHLLANISGIFWVGYFLEQSIGSVKFLIFGLVASTLTEIIYCFIYRTSENNIGGSIYVFALIGLIIVLQILKPAGYQRFHLGTWYGNWILSYAVLGNVPVLPFMTSGTIVTHLLALLTGGVLGALGVVLRII